jgi:hypothetical protein
MVDGRVSSPARALVAAALFVLGVFVTLGWGAACGYTWADNANVSRTGRACGTLKLGVAWVIPFAGFVPALLPAVDGRRFVVISVAIAVAMAAVAVGLAPA